jgi:hypothetical protein
MQPKPNIRPLQNVLEAFSIAIDLRNHPAYALTVPTQTFAGCQPTSHRSRGDQAIVIQVICIGNRIELIP